MEILRNSEGRSARGREKKKLKIVIGDRGFDWSGSGLKFDRGKYSEELKE